MWAFDHAPTLSAAPMTPLALDLDASRLLIDEQSAVSRRELASEDEHVPREHRGGERARGRAA
eukprot:5514803-Pleurochrysis_carterae.AAC.2